MQYQKSILKIYECLVKNPQKDFIIEELITFARVGRTAGFNAISWLEERNLIKIKSSGKQKVIVLIINDTALNFKLFLDSFELKKLDKRILYVLNLFVYLVLKEGYIDVDAILLFGSATTSKNPNDIDLVIRFGYDGDIRDALVFDSNQTKLKHIRKLIENVSDITINLHFSADKDVYPLFEKILVYNRNYAIKILDEYDKLGSLKQKYNEALSDIESIINNINDVELLKQLTQRLITNLAYCFCWAEEKINISKENAISLFKDRYKKELKNFERLPSIEKFNILKGITNEIGQSIFR